MEYTDGLNLYQGFGHSPHSFSDPMGENLFHEGPDGGNNREDAGIFPYIAYAIAKRGIQFLRNATYPVNPYIASEEFSISGSLGEFFEGQIYKHVGVIEGFGGRSGSYNLDPCPDEFYQIGYRIGQDMQASFMLGMFGMALNQEFQNTRLWWRLQNYTHQIRTSQLSELEFRQLSAKHGGKEVFQLTRQTEQELRYEIQILSSQTGGRIIIQNPKEIINFVHSHPTKAAPGMQDLFIYRRLQILGSIPKNQPMRIVVTQGRYGSLNKGIHTYSPQVLRAIHSIRQKRMAFPWFNWDDPPLIPFD